MLSFYNPFKHLKCIEPIPHSSVEVIAGAEDLLHLVVLLVALQHLLNDLVAFLRVEMTGQWSMHGGYLYLP